MARGAARAVALLDPETYAFNRGRLAEPGGDERRGRILRAFGDRRVDRISADDDLVFPRQDGGMRHPDAVSQAFTRARDAAGAPGLRFHV